MLKTTTSKFIFSIAILLASISTTKTMDQFDDSLMLLKLENIKESELQNIRKFKNETTETYLLNLANGDTLKANYFHSGPLKGLISCSRISRDPNSNFVENTRSFRYFQLLKNIAENKQSLTDQEKPAN